MSHGKTVLAWTVVSLAALPALAAEGRIPIFQPTILAGPAIGGKYVLTRNIAAPAGSGPAIQVLGAGAEEVDIDLNGFTVFGDPAGGVSVVEVNGVRTIRLRNGSIRPLGPPPGENLRITSTSRAIVEELRIDDGGIGIYLGGVGSYTVQDNIVHHADTGIFIWGLGVAHTGLVSNNQVKDSTSWGIVVQDGHYGVILRNNRVDGAPVNGIQVSFGDACLVAENTVEHAGVGIYLESLQGCKIVNNVTSSNGDGISGQTDNSLFLDNVATGNQQTGIYEVGLRNRFEGNQASANGCFGVWLNGTDNTFGRNMARSNAAVSAGCPGVAVCTGAPVEICPAPLGGGSAPPDLCVTGTGNTSLCDNLMPGPTPS